MKDSKTFSLTLSSKMMLGILLTVLPAILGGAYYTITLYNRALSAIEEVENLDEIKGNLKTVTEQLKAQQERIMYLMESNTRLQEKASDAISIAREVKAVSEGTTREVNASLTSIRSEVKSQVDGVTEQMKALKKATTNPLGR